MSETDQRASTNAPSPPPSMIPIGLVMKAFGYESTPPSDGTIPNVICMNLQVAQDKIQEHGVFYSRSIDATGARRSQIIDSNWVVVGQSPSAGSHIGEGDAELSAVKIGETTQC